MRQSLRAGPIAVVLLGTVASLAVARSQPAQPAVGDATTGTGAISGVVSDALTGRPIAGASVTLYGIIPGATNREFLPSSVLTDGRGRYVFVNLPSAPRFTVTASKPGYDLGSYQPLDTSGGGALIGIRNMTITLAEGEWKRDADIPMHRAGSIGGRVLDERGEPVVGAAVQLFTRRFVAGRERLVPGAVVTTDDRGAYRVAFVNPGRYVVGVLSVQATVPASVDDAARSLPVGGLYGRGRSEPMVTRTEARGANIDVDGRHRLVLTNYATPPPPGGERAQVYPPVFYPSARTVGDALAVELEPGMSPGSVDLQLLPVPAVRVSGRVTGPVQSAANMMLRLMAPGTEHLGFGAETATAIVEADGAFTFLNVPAGSYTLLASAAVAQMSGGGGSSDGQLPRGVGYGRVTGLSDVHQAAGFTAMWWRSESGAAVWGRAAVNVGDADVAGIEVPLHTTTSVRGRIVFDDPVQPDRRVNLKLEPASGDPSLGMPNAWTDAGDASFAFEITGVQGGRYVFRMPSFGGWRVVSVRANGLDLTDAGIDGAAGQDYSGVVVTVTRSGAALSGVVRGRTGAPAPASVFLFPADSRRWMDYGLTPDRLRSTFAASDGAYSLTSLPGGEYFVIAVPPARSDHWYDPAFLAAAASRATRVSLPAGGAASQDLQVSEVVVR